MASYTNKISRLLKAIEDQIQALIPTAVITHAFTAANADPTLAYNESLAISFSGQVHYVAAFPEAAPASGLTDGLGLTQRVYVPTVIRVGIDLDAEGAGLDTDTEKSKAVLTAVCASKNTRFVLHQKTNVALADLIEGDASIVLNYNWNYDNAFGTMGNQ